MDLGRPITMTEARSLIGMVQYYMDMWPRRSHILAPLTEADSGHKGRKMFCNVAPEESFKEPKRIVSAETLLGYPYFTITFTVHTNDSDKQLGGIIIHDNKLIALFSRIISNPQCNYTMT